MQKLNKYDIEMDEQFILELFQEGHSKEDIANVCDRTLLSIENVIDKQIRKSIIMKDNDFERFKNILFILNKFLEHPKCKEVFEEYIELIRNHMMQGGRFSIDDAMEFMHIETRLLAWEVRLQQKTRNNPELKQNEKIEKIVENSKDKIARPAEYYASIEGAKEMVERLRRFKNNILGR